MEESETRDKNKLPRSRELLAARVLLLLLLAAAVRLA